MITRILIADKFGRFLTELDSGVGEVSWVLNGIGRTSLTLSRKDPKAIQDFLEIGNRLYIEFDNGLPAWGGVLDLPRSWRDGAIKVTAYGLERLLQYRYTGKNDYFYDLTAGYIFKELLRRQNDREPLGITFGEVWTGGRPHWPRYNYKSLWYVFEYSLRKMERCDFSFVPYIADDRLLFRANFYQVAGRDLTQSVVIEEGKNTAEGLDLLEQGEVVNVHHAVSEGQDWGTNRLVVTGRDSKSVAKYGLRETGKVYPGVTFSSTLEMHVRNLLKAESEPRRLFTLEVSNSVPALYSSYNLGDLIRCVLPSFGFRQFDSTVRVIAREFNLGRGSCTLVVEEPNEPEYWIYQEETPEEEQVE